MLELTEELNTFNTNSSSEISTGQSNNRKSYTRKKFEIDFQGKRNMTYNLNLEISLSNLLHRA